MSQTRCSQIKPAEKDEFEKAKRYLHRYQKFMNYAEHRSQGSPIVSFRQACLKQFPDFATVVVFHFGENNHGWTKAWRHSEVSGTGTRSL